MKKALILTLFLVSLGLAVSACVKKPATPAVNQNQNTNTATTTSDIDTSDWKTYRNEVIGIEFDYPSYWFSLESENRGDSEQNSFSLDLPDLSHLDHTLIDYDNISINDQYDRIKCKLGDAFDIECKERISDYGVKYIWRIEKTEGDPSYGAFVPTGKYILLFNFQEAENYNRRPNEYQAVLKSLRIID